MNARQSLQNTLNTQQLLQTDLPAQFIVELGNIEDNENRENDDIISDNEFFEEEILMNELEAETISCKFKQIISRKRPIVYIGNSERTYRRKRAKNKQAAIGTISITNFFSKVTTSDTENNNEDHSENNQSNENENEEDEDEEDENDEDENEDDKNQKQLIKNTIARIEELINNKKLRKIELVQYQSVICYLRLLQDGGKKRDSSKTVAIIHGKGKYRALCIRRWATICLKGNIY